MYSKILFFIVISIVVFGIVFFTARVYGDAFRISHPFGRGTIVTILLIPLLFISSLIGTRSTKWGIGPILYTFINTISGIVFYLFLGALVLGLWIIALLTLHTQVPTVLPWIFVSFSLAVAITGIIQARFARITQYSVTLPNAPISWHGKQAVLLADTHFGLVNRKRFSDIIVNRILSLKPDFVLHAGDFYDGPAIDTTPITASWKNLTKQIPVFYTPGNHEMYGPYNAFIQSIADAGVHVLDNKVMEHDGVQIAGITYHDGKNSPAAAESIESLELDLDRPSILINHPPTSLIAATAKKINLMVSGHTHNGQFWPNTYLVRRVYGPQYYGFRASNDMHTITTNGIGTYGPPMRFLNSPELVLITFVVENK